MQSRQFLEVRQHQQLKLTPQLQQSIRFLQLSAAELEMEIADALLENPLLEQEDEYATDGVAAVADVAMPLMEPASLWPRSGARGDWDGETGRPEDARSDTLQEHLLRQLHATRAQMRDRALVTLLIEELDGDGYLRTPLEEIASCLPDELGIGADELHMGLRLLQSFDPAGIAAQSLADCLVLQLSRIEPNSPTGRATSAEVHACARAIAQHHLDVLATGNLIRLRQALSCSQDTLRSAHALLLRLEPRPARAWAPVTSDYVQPDVLIHKLKGRWQAALNPAVMPRVRVNHAYAQWVAQARDRGPMHSHVQQAHGLVRSVNQRFDTILRVAQIIVEHQQGFFEHGVQAMRPLLLRDVAGALDLHESTVSRATNRKFAQTHWGVIELKRFFGAALAMDDGATTSATAVRSLIADLVAAEPVGKPLSDNRIASRLAEQGVVIARRTVAKYRETAGIESALLRKARASLK